MSRICTLYTVFCFLLTFNVCGQKKLQISYQGDGYQQFEKRIKTTFSDSTTFVTYINELQNKYVKKGHLLASTDSIDFKSNPRVVYSFVGPKFKSATFKIEEIELNFIKRHTQISEKLIANVAFNAGEINSLLRKIENCYLENGFPFVKVSLSEVAHHQQSLKAQIVIRRGPMLKWRKIIVKGDSTLSSKYISNLIGITPDNLYDESLLKNITRKIDQVPFLEEIRPFEILYKTDGVDLYLYIKSIPISSINGVIGFQPDPTTQRLTVTGDVNLKLLNVLKRGELLNLRWKSIRDQTQSLTTRLNYPFLFNTPFGLDLQFDLYKRDTTYLELNSVIGIQYFLNNGSYFKGFYENISSSVLSGGANNPNYSNLGNVTNNMYGIGFSSSQLDYIPNPRKGFNIYVESSFGRRKYQLNDSSQVEKTLTIRGELELDFYIPLARRNVLRLANKTNFYSADAIFENELFRFGGLNTQRGFDEDELLATTKTTSTLEYRFLLDKNSHVFAFGDVTWYENNASQYLNDSPFGFGVGFSFSTNLGVFSISYAMGKQLNNPILFSDSKIHFGYIAYF